MKFEGGNDVSSYLANGFHRIRHYGLLASAAQNVARIGSGGGDEGDPAGLSRCRLLAHPFRQGAGLAKPPTRQLHHWPCGTGIWPSRDIAGDGLNLIRTRTAEGRNHYQGPETAHRAFRALTTTLSLPVFPHLWQE